MSDITLDQIITEYAAPVAIAVGLGSTAFRNDAADYETAAENFAWFLTVAANRFPQFTQNRDWLNEAAAHAGAAGPLGPDSPKAIKHLKRADKKLSQVRRNLDRA